MFEKLKKIFSKPEPIVVPEPVPEPAPAPVRKPRKPRKPKEVKKEPIIEIPKEEVKLSPKDIATYKGEPYVAIVSMNINASNISEGNFELDWNDIFIAKLIKAGYKIKSNDTDADIVDRWFVDVARSIVLEMHEQINADPQTRDLRIIQNVNLGNNRTEVS